MPRALDATPIQAAFCTKNKDGRRVESEMPFRKTGVPVGPYRGEYQHQKSGNRQISDQQESTTCPGTSALSRYKGVYDKREGNYADRDLYPKADPTQVRESVRKAVADRRS